MKRSLIIVLLLSIFAACETSSKQLGVKFSEKNTITVDDLIARINTNPVVNDIQISGKIDKSCRSEGCWFTVKDKDGAEILFDVKDKLFKVPTNSPGKSVVILEDAAQDSTTEQKFTLSVKGIMFK